MYFFKTLAQSKTPGASLFFADSIENNIEKTYTNVENGLVQLQKAVSHQV